jgi:hypothetical protein
MFKTSTNDWLKIRRYDFSTEPFLRDFVHEKRRRESK